MKKRLCGIGIVFVVMICVILGNMHPKQTVTQEKKPVEISQQIVQIENELTATTSEINSVNVKKETKKTDAKKIDNNKLDLETVTDGSLDKKDFSVKINGVVISLGDDFNQLLKELPEADEIDEAKTCIGSGLDKIYTYGDIVIYTNVDEKNNVVYSMELEGIAKTAGDIGVGSELKDIEKIYGKDYTTEAGVYTYALDDMELNFYITNGKVSFIDYYLYLE